jgi:hypothetical protein
VRGRTLFLLGLSAIACAGGTPEKAAEHAAHGAAGGQFPPTGPITLKPPTPPPEGTLYQLVVSYEGRSEAIRDTKGSSGEPETLDEKTSIEIDYRQMPVENPGDGHIASLLVLEAMKRKTRAMPPGKEQLIEIGDDRFRVSLDNKVDTDLRGAQPKQELTPRTLLQKPFALVASDAENNPISVQLRGLPAARKLLASLPLREPIAYLQIPYPDRPVVAGDTWPAKRYLPNPIGKLGLGIDLVARLVGFELRNEAPCAHVSIRNKVDTTNVPSDLGFTFDEVRYNVNGDAWINVVTGEVEEARFEDIGAVAYRHLGAAPAHFRARYEGHASLERLDALPSNGKWADGAKRFSAVK